MKIRSLLAGLVLPLFTAAPGLAAEQEAATGPHGGTLLQQGDLALEILLVEAGFPTEMRVFGYLDGQPLAPSDFEVSVLLQRLGGIQERLEFAPEQDYRVSATSIAEPHSFDISVTTRYRDRSGSWDYSSHEGRTVIPQRLQALAGLETETAGPRTLSFTDTLFGVIAPITGQVYRLDAPYPSLVDELHVAVGDRVNRGQVLATLRNTGTLQSYPLKSPADGEVTALFASVGARADSAPVVEVVDLSRVWVELSAFPENIERLAIGQPVTVYDLHHHEQVQTTVSYIAPQMTGGHIARARAVIPNEDGHWRPGMHLKADIQTSQREVPLAVRSSALQSFREKPVVFARFGDTFEVRMIDPGENDGEYLEVLGGLEPGTEYVTGNSFIIKADVLKDGASHDH